MKNYLFGISLFAENLLKSGVLKEYSIKGLFDNNEKKWGREVFGLKIERPYYSSDIEVIVSTKEDYHMQMIKQLMELGYRKMILFNKVDKGIYEKKVLDYSYLDYNADKNNLVLMFLEYRSYSSIGALHYMYENNLIKKYSFRVKIFYNDKKDNEYYYDLVTARYIITERDWKHTEKEITAKKIQIWHGFPLKTMGHMLKDYDEKRDTYADGWLNFDYILSFGLNYTTFMSACFGTIQKQYAVTGMPRNDLLFVIDGRKNLEEKMPETKGKKIILYMPTFRQMGETHNGRDDGYLFYWKDFNIENLQSFCRSRNLFLLFKLHPCDTSKVSGWCVNSDCMGVLTDDMLEDKCLYEYLNAADILITDYSSVYFDYMLLDRPIIFTDQDVDSYEGGRGFIAEPADFWRPGPILHTFDCLLEELSRICAGQDDHKEVRRRLLPFVHQYQDGNSCQRLFDLMRREQEREDYETI